MEYAPGGNLAERIHKSRQNGQPILVEEAVSIAIEVAAGLAPLHDRDIIHRDLKPSNILFDDKGHAKVADLGLAQVPGGPSMRSRLSQAAPHPGTPAYMSPEQETPPYRLLTPPSDIFALGVVLFEMLTGRNYKILKSGTQAGHLRQDVPGWLDDLLSGMLSENPKERPWDGKEVGDLLRQGQLIGQKQKEVEKQVQADAAEKARLEALELERKAAEKQAWENEEAQRKIKFEKEENERLARQAYLQQQEAEEKRRKQEQQRLLDTRNKAKREDFWKKWKTWPVKLGWLGVIGSGIILGVFLLVWFFGDWIPKSLPTVTPTPSGTPFSTLTIIPTQTSFTVPSTTPYPSPFPYPSQNIPTPITRCDWVSYIGDVTVPDRTKYTPGTIFVKTWRLKNIGTCTWSSSYSLVFVSGEQMGGKASIALPSNVAPYQTIDLSVTLTAPAIEKAYTGYWMLKNASGEKFGFGPTASNSFWVTIIVSNQP